MIDALIHWARDCMRHVHPKWVRATVRLSPTVFYLLIAAFVVIRFIMTADIGLRVLYAPHDDLLYITRAYYLLTDGSLGPYDARTLVKLPGFSFFLAGNRLLGIPYQTTILSLYTAAGIYFISALRSGTFKDYALLLAYVIYLFNPVMTDPEQARVMREPLSISLLVFMLAAMLHIFKLFRNDKFQLIHLLALSVVVAFLPQIREDDVLIYAPFALFSLILLAGLKFSNWVESRRQVLRVSLLIVLPLLSAWGVSYSVHQYIKAHYGYALTHDFGEGEYPRLIATMRSVDDKKDNRYVMITQEALGKLRLAIPSMGPLIDKLPRPSISSYSCQRFHVCSEWTSGYFTFWIKDAAYEAGYTPDLSHAQSYFHELSNAIEKACNDGRLRCTPAGTSIIPPFQLKWTRAAVQEAITAVGFMLLPPYAPPSAAPADGPVDADTANQYRFVTMSSHTPSNLIGAGGEANTFTSQTSLGFGGRIIEELVPVYRQWSGLLLLAGFFSFLYVFWNDFLAWKRPPFLIATVFYFFAGVRLVALSYISVYMGQLDPRMYYAVYVAALLMAPLMIVEAFSVWRRKYEHIEPR